MKKLMIVMLGLFVLAGAAQAASLEVSPKVVSHFFKDVDNATGFGANVDVKGLFPALPLVAITGIESVSAEQDGIDGDAVLWSVGLGYDYAVPAVKGLVVRPYGSLDFASISVEGPVDATNDTGRTLGVQAKYGVNDRVSLFVGLGHQWLDTKLSANGLSQTLNLDNTNLTAGLSVKF